jgi:hypothetical protein
MSSKLRTTLIVALGIWCGVVSLSLAASNTAGQPPSAVIVSPQDSTTTYHVRDMGGRMVTVQVPSMASPDLKVSNPDEGTVRATVRAVDGDRNQVRVQTQAGQMLVLHLSPESVAGMQVGDEFTLQVAR